MHVLLLDSASLYFRAFFGVPGTFRSADGLPVNAVRGFTDMIATLVTDHRPDALVACWDDDWRPQWRVDLLGSYKTHRLADPASAGADSVEAGSVETGSAEEVPDDLSVQVPYIAELLQHAGIARVGAPRCEADDVIGTLVTRLAPGDTCDVVTGDRDLFQLIDDARGVRVLYTGKGGVRNPTVATQQWLRDTYAIPDGDAYLDLAVLRGDASDGLPGVAGIGEKTAATLLGRFGSLTGILEAAVAGDKGVSATQRTRLAQAADYLAVAPQVVTVLRDADLPAHDATLPSAPADPSALSALGERLGVTSSVERLTTAMAMPRRGAPA